MKNLLFPALALIAVLPASGADNSPALVPAPQYLVCDSGSGFDLCDASRIAVPSGDRVLMQTAEYMARELSQENKLTLKPAKSSVGELLLAKDPSLGDEAYRLRIASEGIRIEGGSPAGVFYGFQTLRQLLAQYGTTLPLMRIEDAPAFAYRGAMLDCCRHFFTVEEVKAFLDLLALHKINRFHWHLTDDQGWRIEIRRYPELTKIGSVRSETVLGHNTSACDGVPYGGYYTQAEIREVVTYASSRFIEVIPEIEMPGHASAALATYPWLGCTGSGYKVQTRWGVFPEVFCAGKESTFEFLQQVLAEVIELFPSKYIHLGGDECPKTSWKECPSCQQRIRDEHLKNENELQSYFVLRMERWLNEHGRNMIGWDEILEGGISKSATIMSWRGSSGGIAAARAGNKVIMTPNTHCYLDYYQTSDPQRLEPWGIGGYLPLSKTYSLDPYDRLTEDERSYILGVQANLWTEDIVSLAHVEQLAPPPCGAVSEIGWTCERRDLEDFRRRMEVLRTLYDRKGWRYAPYFFDGTDPPKP